VEHAGRPVGRYSRPEEGNVNAKEAVLRLLGTLPDDASIEDIQYHLYVLQKIRAGEEAADAAGLIPHEEVMRKLAGWLE
jgi:hypothetical protein